MRQRKRADWPVVVYRYWVRLERPTLSDLPQGVQQEAAAMRSLWNQLVDAFARRLGAYREITAPPPQDDASQIAAKIARPVLRQIQQSFLTEARQATTNCSATWADKEFILNQFLAATNRFFKKQSGPPKHKIGPPREVQFHHRFTCGGIPAGRIFGGSQRLCLDPIPPETFHPPLSQRQRKRLARTTGIFQVGHTALSFHTILHRPLPEGAYLKAAALIGQQIVSQGYRRSQTDGRSIPAQWEWSLHLTLELPPHSIVRDSSACGLRMTNDQNQCDRLLVAALDLSCCVGEDGQLRIGVLTDTTGREEALFLPEKILTAWQYKRSLQSQADQYLEEAKNNLRSLSSSGALTPAAQGLLSHLSNARAPGLWRLLQLLEETGSSEEALEILRQWADRSTKLLREMRGLERHYLGHRDWFYRNLALQLCQRYRRLVVMVTDLQPGAAVQGKDPAAREQDAGTYRHLASLARFVTCLQQAAAKTGTEITRESNSI